MEENSISSKLKGLRSSKGISQELLAEEAGVSLRTVQRIESGTSKPSGSTCQRLAEALGISPDVFIDPNLMENTDFLKKLSLSALSFILFPLLGILVPSVLWVLYKDKVKGIDEVARPLINFQITWTLLCVLLPFLIMPLLFVLLEIAMGVFGLHIDLSFISFFEAKLIWFLMYVYNATVTVVNTFNIHDNKATRYFPTVKFLRLK
ncbi:helix-turn-helix domain-containing protein [Echinicola soli]|uniref:Helix-turn-helix domain-containing protein n=1 Tax=Echinicola soli TaxID=2591634 RepID=A0A514CG73_9BACT|nr:helix-turn-helix domain-containing protein [Echinicola soli]QDH78825.1 helix-turn-helix domain-containing protein [Echinicola soli]